MSYHVAEAMKLWSIQLCSVLLRKSLGSAASVLPSLQFLHVNIFQQDPGKLTLICRKCHVTPEILFFISRNLIFDCFFGSFLVSIHKMVNFDRIYPFL